MVKHVNAEWTLLIQKVNHEDAGLYECQVSLRLIRRVWEILFTFYRTHFFHLISLKKILKAILGFRHIFVLKFVSMKNQRSRLGRKEISFH